MQKKAVVGGWEQTVAPEFVASLVASTAGDANAGSSST
jgi:hypothetical protein